MGIPVEVESKFVQKCSMLLIFSSVVVLFICLNNVQPYYFIDEVFHVPQTLQYCAGNFTQWDPKITTLPGLYLLTTLVLSPLNLCNLFYMRCINLLGTIVNFYLAYNIIKQISIKYQTQRWNNWMKLTVASNIMLFPPLFFWHFLYYTDIVSVNAVLLMFLLHLRRKFEMAAFIGLLSILIRQTNIIWVAFVTVERAFDLLDQKLLKSITQEEYSSFTYLKLLWKKIMEEASHGWAFFSKFVIRLIVQLLPYATVCLIFLAFVVWNKGIVVGDRAAHVPTIHIPQLFYFSAFISCFLWPYTIIHWKSYLNSVKEHWILHSCLLALLIATVHFNTLVHPYILADNRHYVFYFWNKFMGRYRLFKYLLIPGYSFAFYTMFHRMMHLRFATQINYILMTSMVLIPQLLIEPRYFIIPYILYRLLIREPKSWQVIMESITVFIVNFLQFYIFINKVFYWSDQPDPQRISW
ncbi:PREDICTED: putative Dol-P-Glc:Glc(2)Man(9)GlcNAc(2)-PP-Dol alpha-1,2-glucosyltransferase [Dufourea novaeangliae]|uniref:Dol-P-Glc:Glc(2)Man(9)GlcNAc(2)-PP-Dol alpha-1,2-glucosyltransferase n=1 Tax=Dufourea novaeangliae TaxID=178035 RepID=A0A154PSD5_DUFNO|nr:PREDICTED: putative Dol-P-Glc:Glc(2)Man(9)GlcNAc(2)-PP-Dol alpha-1,2-glucosyltransferase [Dufourea novaeangliae]KZC14819.1 Putative Dol-P-Glc:Glc(2)Man(9)GlcNAc(2)-PP-Dol alpha-1,2-glucosyltransferase [Dufourea novaeangliae]